MAAALAAVVALTACRKEVPTPPVPVPSQDPKPKVQTAYAAPNRTVLTLQA
jgi:hypothetical protein